MIVKEFKKKGPVYKVQTFGTLQCRKKAMDIHIDFESGSKFPCAKCGKSSYLNP